MRCPYCDEVAALVGPDYGFGYGVAYRCYCRGEVNFISHDPEAKAESDALLGRSRRFAAFLREGHLGPRGRVP